MALLSRTRPLRALALGLFAFSIALGAHAADPPPAADDAAREETVATMREIFESIRVLLPLTVSAERFGAPEERASVEQALLALHTHADALSEHARSRDAARRFLGDALAKDAKEALARYRAGHYAAAAFQIQQATETCVACHTKLEGPAASPAAKDFVAKSALVKLPLAERARLQVATRDFDAAAKSYETLLADRRIHAGELLAPLTEYLIVEVRVRSDFERARRTLERFAKRPDLWRHLAADVSQWKLDLRELTPQRDAEPSIETARALIERARTLQTYPADRRGLVHYLLASSILQRVVGEPSVTDRDAGEAYYLLGLCETHVGESYWVSQADLYLETAIRIAPKEPFAEEAYLLLEEETVIAYTGNSGTELPESVAEHLDELRRLIDR